MTILNIENMLQNVKNKTLPLILQCKQFWREVACVRVLLNVIHVMAGTRRQNGYKIRVISNAIN